MTGLLTKKLWSLVLSSLISLFTPAKAYQGPVQLGWWWKASGSAQVVLEANHLWVEGYDAYGNYLGRLGNYWLDWYCQVGPITSGTNQGTPLRIQLVAPAGSGQACLPVGDGSQNYWNVFYGWTNGLGSYSGSNVYNPGYVLEYESYVFPRDPSSFNSRGTTLEYY